MIILIATGHEEIGMCNSNELYKIIEQISPNVIFEEIPLSKYDAVYKGFLKDSLETLTIKRYLQKYPIEHVAVDLDIDQAVHFHVKNEMTHLNEIFKISYEYCDLLNYRSFLAEQHGFHFFNSRQFELMLQRKQLLEEQLLQSLNQENYLRIYTNWMNIIADREVHMISNIYYYTNRNKYERAVFFVGAEHRKPIINILPKFEENNKQQLNWNFEYFQQATDRTLED